MFSFLFLSLSKVQKVQSRERDGFFDTKNKKKGGRFFSAKTQKKT